MEIDKINVGMYVRTKGGHILKYPDVFIFDEVLKSSHNIIDLIEVGDYVNGSKVTEIENRDDRTILYRDYDSDYYFSIEAEEIKSIVTKEQFESMSYKIGD